jgi:hypothetical protein
MTRSRSETRRSREAFTAAEDALIQRLEKAGYGATDIATATATHTAKQVVARLYFLAHGMRSRAQVVASGWPVHDTRKQDDWGKGFFNENYTFKSAR